MKNQLHTRTYEGGNGEEVIVVGNRKDVSDPVEGVMEAEFVFRNDELISVNAVQFRKPHATAHSMMSRFDDHLDDLAFEPIHIPTEAEILADFGVVEPND
jgi:hypothetical protein